MKRVILTLSLVFLFVLIPVLCMSAVSSDEPPAKTAAASVEPVINCSQVRINERQVRITCSAAGIQLLNTVMNLPEVKVPGPTIRLPGETHTVPGPTRTVTLSPKTVAPPTVTITPETETKTVRPPTETVTVSPSETSTRQAPSDDDTLDSGNREDPEAFPDVDFSWSETVGIGIITVIIFSALILLGMWAGYYMGYKDSEKKEADFLRSLLGKKDRNDKDV